MKKCPYCAEEIQDAAIVCKHCGRELAPEAVALISQAPKETRPEPAQEVQPSAETKKRISIWPYSIGGGLILAALASIPRLVSLSEISESISQGLLGALAFRAGLQDLAFAVATNWIIWSLVIAGSVALWRNYRNWFYAVFAIVGLVAVIYYLSEVSPNLESGAVLGQSGRVSTLIPQTQTNTNAATAAQPTSEQELFVEYDAKLRGWFDELEEISKIEQQGDYMDRIRATMLIAGLYDKMLSADPPPNLRIQHTMFVSFVEVRKRVSKALSSIPPDTVELDRLNLESLELLDEAIEVYADYGTSLGFDMWTGVCVDVPDHYRCK